MYLRIYQEVGNKNFWGEWAFSPEPHYPKGVMLEFGLGEGSGFLSDCSNKFDLPSDKDYDPVRCGVFADWLQDNEDRLLDQIEEQDRPLAAERLSQLRDWLRSGFQKSS